MTEKPDLTLWGPAPTDVELYAARGRAQTAVNAAVARALDGALTAEQTAARLRISPREVAERASLGTLTALRSGQAQWFPVWQFHGDGPVPGIESVIEAYPGGALSLTVWMTTANADLNGLTPARMLARGSGIGRVLEAIRALGPDAW